MDRDAAGAELDTAVGDVISIAVNSEDPGVQFEGDRDGNAAVVKGWERASTGKFGLLQKHGGIHLGDVLFAVNDVPLDNMPYTDVMALVGDRNLMKKTLKFMSSSEYYRRKNVSRSTIMATQESKNSFLSIIRRARISESGGNKYVEYEIACQMRVLSQHVQKEVIHKWSVWKRYSEFELLHREIRKNLGWQMRNIDLPASHTFVINKMSADFIEQRRSDLDSYWQRVLSIEKITEFTKHHCSQDIKEFINVEATLSNSKTIMQSSNSREMGIEEMRRENPGTADTKHDPHSGGSPAHQQQRSVGTHIGATRTLASLRRRAVRQPQQVVNKATSASTAGLHKIKGEVVSVAITSTVTTLPVHESTQLTTLSVPTMATDTRTVPTASAPVSIPHINIPPPPPPQVPNPPTIISAPLLPPTSSAAPPPPVAAAAAVLPPAAIAPARVNLLGAIKAMRKFDE